MNIGWLCNLSSLDVGVEIRGVTFLFLPLFRAVVLFLECVVFVSCFEAFRHYFQLLTQHSFTWCHLLTYLFSLHDYSRWLLVSSHFSITLIYSYTAIFISRTLTSVKAANFLLSLLYLVLRSTPSSFFSDTCLTTQLEKWANSTQKPKIISNWEMVAYLPSLPFFNNSIPKFVPL